MLRSLNCGLSSGCRSGGLETLLQKKGFTLEDALGDDGFLGEISSQNSAAIDFLTPKRFRKLIDYIITMPESDEDPDRAFKYPYAASEILGVTNPGFLDLYFLANEVECSPVKLKQDKTSSLNENEDNVISSETDKSEEKNELSINLNDDDSSGKDTLPVVELLDLNEEMDNTSTGKHTNGSENGESKKFQLIDHLFSFLDIPPSTEINELLAGYFKKAVFALIVGKPKEMVEYFESNEDAITRLFLHSSSKSISEVLVKVLSMEEINFCSPGKSMDMREEILNAILSRIEEVVCDLWTPSEVPIESCKDQLCQTFCEIVESCKEAETIICSKNILSRILKLSLHPRRPVSISALTILTKLITRQFIKDYLDQALSPVPISEDLEAAPEDSAKELLKFLCHQLKMFKEFLINPMESETNQMGVQVEQFGSYRLKVVEYLASLIRLMIFPVIDQMFSLEYPKLLLELFPRFPFNSVLHNTLYEIFKFSSNSNSLSLQHVFILNSQFISFLIKQFEEPFFSLPREKTIRKPFIGYITQLGNCLNKMGYNEAVKKFLDGVPEWNVFKKGALAENNARNEIALGGSKAPCEQEDLESVPQQDETHLTFESNLANILQRFKEMKFDNEIKRTEPQEESSDLEVECNPVEEVLVPEVEQTNPSEDTQSTAFFSSTFWKSGPIYTLSELEDDYS